MTITAKIIAHSRVEGSPDLITMQLRYPRFIHAEFMTHRVFSRNASSSRAVPVDRMIQDVMDEPAMPVSWGREKSGMQAGETLTRDEQVASIAEWIAARNYAVERARAVSKVGAHKQIVNRLLEPFAHISVVVTATEWDNFFDLRCHADADPTIQLLALTMRRAISASSPLTPISSCHLPYVTQDDVDAVTALLEDPEHGADHLDLLPLISAARCARVSYLNHDGSQPDIQKDLVLANRLRASKHMSPFEHQAIADPGSAAIGEWGNFVGWKQFRKQIEHK